MLVAVIVARWFHVWPTQFEAILLGFMLVGACLLPIVGSVNLDAMLFGVISAACMAASGEALLSKKTVLHQRHLHVWESFWECQDGLPLLEDLLFRAVLDVQGFY